MGQCPPVGPSVNVSYLGNSLMNFSEILTHDDYICELQNNIFIELFELGQTDHVLDFAKLANFV